MSWFYFYECRMYKRFKELIISIAGNGLKSYKDYKKEKTMEKKE